MFELDYIKKALAGRGRQVVFILILSVVGFSCVVLSIYWSNRMSLVMGDYQDCSWVHTIPGPTNCASSERMAVYEDLGTRSQISLVFGIIIFFGLLVGAFLQNMRRESSKALNIPSITD